MVGRSFSFPSWTVLIVIRRPSCRRVLEPRGQKPVLLILDRRRVL